MPTLCVKFTCFFFHMFCTSCVLLERLSLLLHLLSSFSTCVRCLKAILGPGSELLCGMRVHARSFSRLSLSWCTSTHSRVLCRVAPRLFIWVLYVPSCTRALISRQSTKFHGVSGSQTQPFPRVMAYLLNCLVKSSAHVMTIKDTV